MLAELLAREPIFHHPELGAARADLEAMVDEDFWEVGASGRRYSRAYCLDVVERRFREPEEERWEISDPHCRRIATDVYLFTYTLDQQGRITRRATLWKMAEGTWSALYHQGTVVQDAAAD